jgi:hypothetical protein
MIVKRHRRQTAIIITMSSAGSGISLGTHHHKTRLNKLTLQMTTNQTLEELTHTKYHESHKTLGTHICIIRQEITQYEVLLDKSKKFAKRVVKAQ